jgi:hypothetical protein
MNLFETRRQAAIIFSFVIGIASRKVCIGFCRSTNVPDVAVPHCILDPRVQIGLPLWLFCPFA